MTEKKKMIKKNKTVTAGVWFQAVIFRRIRSKVDWLQASVEIARRSVVQPSSEGQSCSFGSNKGRGLLHLHRSFPQQTSPPGLGQIRELVQLLLVAREASFYVMYSVNKHLILIASYLLYLIVMTANYY